MKLKEEFYEKELQNFEGKKNLANLVQNDVSTKYGFDFLNGKLNEKFEEGYLSSQMKFADDGKENTKIANFKKQILAKKDLKQNIDLVKAGMNTLGELFLDRMNQEFIQSEHVQKTPGDNSHVLEKDAEFLEHVQSDLLTDNFDELQKVQILPTGKRETRYLLGIEDNEEKNPIEQFLEQAVGKRSKQELTNHFKDRRNIGGVIDPDAFSGPGKYSGTFQNLMDKYEKKNNKKMLIVKTNKGQKKTKKKSLIDYVSIQFVSNSILIVCVEIRCLR